MNGHRVSRRGRTTWVLGTAAGALAAMLVLPLLRPTPPAPKTESPLERRARMQAILGEQLGWAKEQGDNGTTERLTRLVAFFDEAKLGTDAFAEEVLGWNSKWAAAQDAITGEQSHQAVIEELFAKHLFDPADLDRFLARSVEDFVRHVDDIDAQFLVRLEADLGDLSADAAWASDSSEALRASLARAAREVSEAVMADLQGTLGRELASLVAGQILSQAATQWGASAGILGTGAASGAMSFGVGLGVGVAVDWLVSWAYEEMYHPQRQISAQMWSHLDELSRLIIYGHATDPGFLGWMLQYHEQRVQARAQAMQTFLNP